MGDGVCGGEVPLSECWGGCAEPERAEGAYETWGVVGGLLGPEIACGGVAVADVGDGG